MPSVESSERARGVQDVIDLVRAERRAEGPQLVARGRQVHAPIQHVVEEPRVALVVGAGSVLEVAHGPSVKNTLNSDAARLIVAGDAGVRERRRRGRPSSTSARRVQLRVRVGGASQVECGDAGGDRHGFPLSVPAW